VCGSLVGAQITRCYAAANGRWIDPGAARTCGQLVGAQVIQCVATVAGKDYTDGELRTCAQAVGSQISACLSRTGRLHFVAAPPPPPAPPSPHSGASAVIPRRKILQQLKDIQAAVAQRGGGLVYLLNVLIDQITNAPTSHEQWCGQSVCSAQQYCEVRVGGAHMPNGEWSQGCAPLPAACQGRPSCACLGLGSCQEDDLGRFVHQTLAP
jgi:hypothetical protein